MRDLAHVAESDEIHTGTLPPSRRVGSTLHPVDLHIRQAQFADLAGVLELYRHLNPADVPIPAGPAMNNVWAAILTQPGFTCLVGVHADALVASCCLAILPNLTRGGRPYALIENVVTHQDFRRRGFARAMLTEALRRAWDAGCYKAMLLSGSKRSQAHQLYEACGFRADEKTGFVARPR